MKSLALLLSASCVGAAAESSFTLYPSQVITSGRIDYVLGDGRFPEADADARRTSLHFNARAQGRVAVLGYANVVIDQAVTDTGEKLQLPPRTESAATWDHRVEDHGIWGLFSLDLPSVAAPYRALAELTGSVELITAVDEPTTWTVPLARLGKDDDTVIDGYDELGISLAEADANKTVFHLTPEASLAVVDLTFSDASGKSIAVKDPYPRMSDDREPKPARKRSPSTGPGDLVQFNTALPHDVVVRVSYHAVMRRQRQPFAFTAIALGVTVAERSSGRKATPRGADDF